MSQDPNDPPHGFASPPCLAHEIDPQYFDPLAVDSGQARDVARWRKAERVRLRDARAALSVDTRQDIAAAMARHMDGHLATLTLPENPILSGYWPIKSEPDLRFWLTKLHENGWRIALPIVEVEKAPLVFRIWTPGMAMERGVWNIPVPPSSAEQVIPHVALAPMLGWDRAGFRLGYGGGYFDRTLAALASHHPHVIGLCVHAGAIPTIYPQPHDIAMSAVITEKGVQVVR